MNPVLPPTVSPKTSVTKNGSAWTAADSANVYGIDNWSNGYFGVSPSGDVEVYLRREDGQAVAVSLPEVVAGIGDRGFETPLLIRFPDLLAAQIRRLNDAFAEGITANQYRGKYRGVYPIKVNQQQQVIQEVARFGRQYHVGLEAGSKPELLAALAYMHDPDALIICNGYKDREYIDLTLNAVKMGLQVILVLEMPDELDLIFDRSEVHGVKPLLGLRAKLAARNESKWSNSSGESSVFGLTPDQVINVVDQLRGNDWLDCLRMLHFHQGSQVPDIRAIREAVVEASRIYVELVREGAAMGLLDIGGGLAIDYDGSKSNTSSSRNYGLVEYASDIIESIMTVCDDAGTEHPDIISESGRAIAAYYSVLVFNILNVTRFVSHVHAHPIPEPSHPLLASLREVDDVLNEENVQECYNDIVYYRQKLLSLFNVGQVSLRERACAESLYWHINARILKLVRKLDAAPLELKSLAENVHDVYYGNFSVFQSLPDAWAINQVFPIMPIHRLDEKPDCRGIVADVTCDCDGRLDQFLINGQRHTSLPLHEFRRGENYFLAAFIVGSYQETLGDLHNLFGDPNVVSVGVKDGRIQYLSELDGDTVSDVLSYVEHNPDRLVTRFRKLAEQAVEDGRITPVERRKMLATYEKCIRGYTYLKQ